MSRLEPIYFALRTAVCFFRTSYKKETRVQEMRGRLLRSTVSIAALVCALDADIPKQ
jgi:hypothetical protein